MERPVPFLKRGETGGGTEGRGTTEHREHAEREK